MDIVKKTTHIYSRLILNYKRLHYQTQWVAFPDITTTLSGLGVRANRGQPHYTLPAIRSENKLEVVMNCFDIAMYLDTEYEARRVIPKESKDLQSAYGDQINNFVQSRMLPLLLPTVKNIIQEGRDRDVWNAVMFQKFGMDARFFL